MASVLIVEDRAEGREALAEWLRGRFEDVKIAGSVVDGRALILAQSFDLVLLDLNLPDGSGLMLLEVLEEQPDTEVVVVTGHGTIDSAIEAFRGGAVDYLKKPVDLPSLDKIATRVLQTVELRGEVASLRDELRRLGRFGQMVGTSEVMQDVYRLIAKVAPMPSTVLITGETGTGKELVAQTVHRLSRRSQGPWVAINCSAVAPNLIESELFGHERGSFTGADRQHRGIFEQAQGGTLFLDEIAEMPLELQVRLLRVLEAETVTRIGGSQPVPISARIVAATNQVAETAVNEGRLRSDLLYRLNVFPIRVPPLRERREDIELLAQHFLERLNEGAGSRKRFARSGLDRLRQHPWPGNVRELRNVVERAFVVSGDEIDARSVPLNPLPLASAILPAPSSSDRTVELGVGLSLEEAERRLILATLGHLDGDKKEAARLLGVSLKTLYNRLHRYDASSPPSVSADE